jgi:GT2 family glycosyltransferase
MAVANQTRPVDKLVIFDDNDSPEDLREHPVYKNLFCILNQKGIKWEWLFAGKKGQHHNHQIANNMGYDWVWRVDDDAIPEPTTLEVLVSHIADDVGAIGGAILMPGRPFDTSKSTGLLEKIDSEANLQWAEIKHLTEVDHLHCSFLYRAGVVDYNLGLSRVAHREETMFTYSLKKKGYRVLAVPGATTWHLKAEGGIRMEKNAELYAHDERIFQNFLKLRDNTVVVLNGGMGDHIVFTHLLPEIKNPAVFGCYPEIIPGRSIAEAQQMLGDIEPYSIYKKMHQWGWKDSLEKAYRKMYL